MALVAEFGDALEAFVMGSLYAVFALVCVCGFASTDNDSPIYNIKIRKESVKLSEVAGLSFRIVIVGSRKSL